MMKDLNVQLLLDWLENHHYLPKRNEADAYILCQENHDPVPLYIHILLGIGAFVGFWSAVGLLYASGLINWDNPISLITFGVLSIIISILINHLLKNAEDLLHSFSQQLTCILMLMGKILFAIGLTHELHNQLPHIGISWLATLSIALVAIPTYYLFPIAFDRFISSLAFIFACMLTSLIEFHHNIFFYLVYIALLALVGWLINAKNKKYSLEALTYSGLTSLGIYALLLCSSAMPYVLSQTTKWHIPIIVFNLTLAIAIVLQCSLLKLPPPRNTLSFAAGCLSLLILGMITTNGILYAMGLMLLGYEKHRRNLIIFGILFLGFFLIDFYYNLSLSLAHKAAILAGSGAILLLTRMVLLHEHWDKEP
ncbi:DUF4401 domain-containing protein [Candidatus Berkiella aquae]|uniref:DUF4401 domain-containing protein n=1 Tax=Candidatus Berkiella aquae TaxID=295108 RepID=A0A0Q9Z1U4_9GAMM|nr:DUF4401 domain-containing protein [Candidatus Berkiella aquae]MCS5712347.1 DUF4401 domain-containing protein [Candidatus Berkiella aquae]